MSRVELICTGKNLKNFMIRVDSSLLDKIFVLKSVGNRVYVYEKESGDVFHMFLLRDFEKFYSLLISGDLNQEI